MTQWLNQNTRVRLRISFLVQITFHSKTYKAQIRHDPVNLSKYLCTYTKGISAENIKWITHHTDYWKQLLWLLPPQITVSFTTTASISHFIKRRTSCFFMTWFLLILFWPVQLKLRMSRKVINYHKSVF